jgi:type I restriction enzyme M protein
LFDKAKSKWEGVFSEDAKISLTPSHLSICVASLENVKLFNSNLDVVDEAFEYLINQSSKGEKGQFFTPRYVIDMCVKMLNPKEDEYMIDTAAGSSGFPVHTMFHVWKQILEDEGKETSHLFSVETKPYRCTEYVENKVFAIDFDEKAVRVARTLNLIAGDGETNVLHLNTLDFERWDEWTQQEEWNDVYNNGFKRLKRLQATKGSYQKFNFDILMANPPFAGDIKESSLIQKYDLSVKDNGKRHTKMGRDILFIERNLDFLKPGGRMAIVLPQGRFNNSSDKYIRDYIAQRCRILAVIGLHGNTFKPHTGTKTSVLLVQKWDDLLCPKVEDYKIFFATMQKSGKDNSGDKIYLTDESNNPILDDNGHLIIDHDLFNHDGKTEDGIAEAFIEFAKKEGLSFFDCRGERPFAPTFDKIKYQGLMDKLEATEIKYSNLERTNRIDAEFFKKEYINIQSILNQKHLASITEYVKVFDGNHMKISDNFADSGIPYYRGQDIHYFFIEQSSPIYIDENTYNLPYMKRSHLKKGDVLLSIVGTIGSISLVDTDKPATCNCKLAILRPKNTIKSEFLATYLSSKFGQNQIRRFTRGAVQMGLILEDMDQLLIPNFSKKLENFIVKVIDFAKISLKQSQSLYQQAEELLLTELGLKDWQPTDDNITEKSFSESFLVSGRLDAEYYQPKYDYLEQKLEQCNYVELKNIAKNISTGFPYDSSNFVTEGIDLIRINNITQDGLDLSNAVKISLNDSLLRPKNKVKYGDVLISMSGTIGLSCCVQENINAFVNQRIMKLEPINFNSDLLSFIINSIIVKMQLERVGTGGVQTNLSNDDILNIKIPVISVNTQNKIISKITESKSLKQQSKQLLEIAKIGVEKAIETDEETAINWINEQLQILGIEV